MLTFLVALFVDVSPVRAALPLRVVRPVGTSTLSRDQLEQLVQTYHQAAIIWRTNAEIERAEKEQIKGDLYGVRLDANRWKEIATRPPPEPDCPTRWTIYLTAGAGVAGFAAGVIAGILLAR